MLNYTQIKKLYFSYLTPEQQKDPETLEIVEQDIARDLEGQEKRMKEDAVASLKRKGIFSWKGTCKELRKLLNIKIKNKKSHTAK